ncbi:MAG TPA: YicC family protein [Clostridiales bacterium]|nr:YicC family protein [Clostridiales bacterium]
MVRSMTGFGHAKENYDGYDISFEIRGVNHRFFEFYSRIPRNYSFLEEKIKSLVQTCVSRGKIECQLQIDTGEREKVTVKLNKALLDGYLRAFDNLEKLYGVKNDISTSSLLRVNDLFVVEKQAEDEERIVHAVLTVAAKALESFVSMRELEGSKLRDDIIGRVESIYKNLLIIEERSPQTVKEYNEKIISRMQDLIGDTEVDPQRLLTEAAIFADKIAVAEETIRLRSHLSQLVQLFESEEPVGRKMDFLIQEINREANTIGSKAQDLEIAKLVVEIKSDIEKIREQAQNIE